VAAGAIAWIAVAARIADLVSFYPEKVTSTVDGEKLDPAPGRTVAGPRA
jgi:hypothetical protein